MITFTSSTFNGSESSEVIIASVTISGGIVSSRNIKVLITFTPRTAAGYYAFVIRLRICRAKMNILNANE